MQMFQRNIFSFSSTIIEWELINLKKDDNVSAAANDFYCIYNKRSKWLDTFLSSQDKDFFIQESNSSVTKKWQFKETLHKGPKDGYNFYYSLPLFFS
jgi:hypothetical protein